MYLLLMKIMHSDANNKYAPKILVRNLNSIALSWGHLIHKKSDEEARYRLQICNEFKEWKTVYWGKKTKFNVEGLSPCTCYNFRIQLEPKGVWTTFKAATYDEGPYCLVLHMARAIKLGKTSVIRKIAHNKPHLLETENKENKTPLVQAIETGDVQILQLLINLGANVNTPLFYNKRTPLMIAVYSNKLQMASVLVDKGAHFEAKDINGLNVLHYAVDSDLLENVKFALNLGLDINSTDSKKWTPLIRAAILNVSEEIINVLMENGASTNCKDINGFDYKKHRYIASLYPVTKKLD